MTARRQHGAALLAMVSIIAMGVVWWLLAVNTPTNRGAMEREHNARVLNQAKQALLGWIASQAATDPHPGRMPCPEHPWHIGNATNEGTAGPAVTASPGWGSPWTNGTCATDDTLPVLDATHLTPVTVGRFPWKTVGLDKPYDAAGEPLWFVTTYDANSWAYRTTATVLSLNSNKLGDLRVDGVPNGAVAAIIAPGRPLNMSPNANQTAAGCATRLQNRSPTGTKPKSYLDYLECQPFNSTAPGVVTKVVDNFANEVMNDQMVFITAAEIMAAIEPVVAARMLTTVVPQLKAVYATSDWGQSAATPVFPYAARFQNGGAFNPDAYKGTVGQSQGLLPMTSQTCVAMTSGRCDATFVQWTLGSFTVTRTGGTATLDSVDCAGAGLSFTTSQITCTITYSQLIGLLSDATISLAIRVDAANVGRTLKKVTLTDAMVTPIAPATKTGFSFGTTLRADANASARVSTTGTLTGAQGILFCGFLGLACTGRATLTLPISMFQDHPLVNPATSDAWYWFTVNKWHEVTYYAVAASHLPNGDASHKCNTAGVADCLTLTNGSPAADISSMLVLAGRSLTNTTRPNGTLTDFLDDTPSPAANLNVNRDNDKDFFKGTPHVRAYNDRFVPVANY
jgi:hypothetical protein